MRIFNEIMRGMNKVERKQIEWLVKFVLTKAVSEDYARYILEHKDKETKHTFMNDVIEDVLRTSSWEKEGCYNEDDVRLAIGRVLIDRLGIEY